MGSESPGDLPRVDKRCDFDRLVASHDGYARLKDPVIHRRELMFDRKSDRLTVVDTVECRGQHRILRYLHFAEDCDVRVVNDRLVEAYRNDGRMQVRLDGNPCAIDLLCGSDEPPAGWVSRTFGEKRAAPTVRLTSEIRGTQQLRLVLTLARRLALDLHSGESEKKELSFLIPQRNQLHAYSRTTVSDKIPRHICTDI